MKVEKIEIKKELMDIPNGRDRVDFALIPPMVARMAREGEVLSDNVIGQKVTYEVRKTWNLTDGYKDYLVKVDDRQIFDDLIKITKEDVDREVAKRTEHLAERVKLAQEQAIEGIRDARWHVVMTIKKLPWYTRLFNSF